MASTYHEATGGRSLDNDERAINEFGDIMGDMLDDYTHGNLLAPFGISADPRDEEWDILVADTLDAYLMAPVVEQVEYDVEDHDYERAIDEFRNDISEWILRRFRETYEGPVVTSKFVVLGGDGSAHIVEAMNKADAERVFRETHDVTATLVRPLTEDAQ